VREVRQHFPCEARVRSRRCRLGKSRWARSREGHGAVVGRGRDDRVRIAPRTATQAVHDRFLSTCRRAKSCAQPGRRRRDFAANDAVSLAHGDAAAETG